MISAAISKIALLSLFLLLSAGIAAPTDVVEWSIERPLQWSDFQGRVPADAIYGAVTAYEVRSSNTFPDWQHVNYEVTCVLVKGRSWVKPELRADSALLDHERLHFDLAECSARALRSKLQEERMTIKECNQRLQTLRDSVHNSWLSLENRYDLETSHGTIAKEQLRWAKKIAHTLDNLAAYSEPRFVVELKP